MKLHNLLAILVTSAAAVHANSLFAHVPNTNRGVAIGEKHNIVWMSDALETLEICVVRKGDEARGDPPDLAWKYVDCLFVGKGNTPGGRISWKVEDWFEPGSGYALRLEADPRGFGKWLRKSSVDMTDWFDIAASGRETDMVRGVPCTEQEKIWLNIPQEELQMVI